jgi:chromosome segregation ATPase
LAKLHEEVNHVRSKEACVRSQLIRSEQERGKLQDENSSLRRQLNGRDASIASLQDNSHFAVREKHELMVQLQAATVGRVETWRAERWRRKLSDVKGRNDVLAGELEVSRQRLIRLEAKAERAELELEAVTGLEEILARPMAEAYRQAAHLTEQALHQRLDNSKVRRELSLQTEKVRYLEAVNAELEARLEEYEAEAFRNQVN